MGKIYYIKDFKKEQKDNLVTFPNSKPDDIPVIFMEDEIADEYNKKDYKLFWRYIMCFSLGILFKWLII